MSQMTVWKCLECDMEAHYKGLCRSCSEYDDSGKVLKPVQRTRLNADGSVWEVTDRRVQPAAMTLAAMRAHRKSQKKLTKKKVNTTQKMH